MAVLISAWLPTLQRGCRTVGCASSVNRVTSVSSSPLRISRHQCSLSAPEASVPRSTLLKTHKSSSGATCDVLIVGGGVMGACIAYHTKLLRPGLRVCVVERDPQYVHASAMLSAGGLRQQFSLAANIDLSLYGIDFLRRVSTDLRLPGEDAPDIQFREQGYLFLASDMGEKVLRENHETQRSRGVDWMSLLTQDELARRFPWLNVDGLSLGSLGEANEGWFDPWALLTAVRAKSRAMGVEYIKGTVEAMTVSDEGTRSDGRSRTSSREGESHGLAGETGAVGHGDESCVKSSCFSGSGDSSGSSASCDARIKSIECVHIRGDDGVHAIRAGTVVNAAGAFAARVVSMCGDVATLPVAARKRCIFSVHCAQAQHQAQRDTQHDVPPMPPESTTPLVVDPSGVYMRPEGPPARYLCGVSPPPGWGDPDSAGTADLDLVDHALFDEIIWPALYHRCEAFGSLKVQSSWAGFYEYNTFDQNAIIGPHPHVSNLVLCNGFSGHGLQHAPGAGLAVAEWLTEGRFRTIDVSCFGFERVMRGERVLEHGIV